jgi:folate-binding protein YgfZ
MTKNVSSLTRITRLDHYGIIRGSGEDAFSFLQGQFGNDLARVDAQHHQLNCYSNPQGRLLAILRIFRRDENYYLRLPKDILTPTLNRLKMFVLMSKVVLENVGDSLAGIGISGDSAASVVASVTGSAPAQVNTAISVDGISILRVPGIEDRFEIYARRDAILSIWTGLETHCELAGEDEWMHGELLAGIPSIFDATREEFVAQMTNLQLIDGLSFKKGCYPGQEIVARMHYLGKLKRRMYLTGIDSADAPHAGDSVFSGKGGSPVGKVVDARVIAGQSPLALMVLSIAAAESGDLHLGAADGPAVTLQTLPYAFESE